MAVLCPTPQYRTGTADRRRHGRGFPMKKCILAKLIAVVSLLLLSGCATVTRGTKDTLVIESDPAGADIRLSTGQVGKTPTSFKLPRGQALVVTISKEGYETLNVNVNPQVVGAGAAGMAGNVLVGGLIGAGIDGFSGAMKDLKPNPVSVKLVRIEPKIAAVPPTKPDQAPGRDAPSETAATKSAPTANREEESPAPTGAPSASSQ